MPAYIARDVSIKLLAADLCQTTLAKPHAHEIPTTDHVADQIEKTLRDGVVLSERRVCARASHDDSNKLQFIGSDENIPFCIVLAGQNIMHSSETMGLNTKFKVTEPHPRRTTRRTTTQHTDSADPPPDHQQAPTPIVEAALKTSSLLQLPGPYALALQIKLDRAAFQTHQNQLDILHDVRVDIFFNGDISESTFIPRPQVGQPVPDFTKSILCSGLRVHNITERPWILVPPGQGPGGEIIEFRGKRFARQERWTQIGVAMMKHAEALQENHEAMNHHPLINCLQAIANLPIPDELCGKDDYQAFGVIDVVLSTGQARQKDKQDSGYITLPELMGGKALGGKTWISTLNDFNFNRVPRHTTTGRFMQKGGDTSIPAMAALPLKPAFELKSGATVDAAPKSKGDRALPALSVQIPATLPSRDSIMATPLTPSNSDLSRAVQGTQPDKASSQLVTPLSASRPRSSHGRDFGFTVSEWTHPEILNKYWHTPESCKGSHVAYTEDGAWRTNSTDCGLYRTVKPKEKGEFVENDVLFAVRYVII